MKWHLVWAAGHRASFHQICSLLILRSHHQAWRSAMAVVTAWGSSAVGQQGWDGRPGAGEGLLHSRHAAQGFLGGVAFNCERQPNWHKNDYFHFRGEKTEM